VQEIKDNIARFIHGCSDFTSSERQSMLDGLDSASDEQILWIQRAFKGALTRCVKIQWEKQLKKYIDSEPETYAVYRHRGGTMNAPDFMELHWGKFIDQGVLFQNTLRDYDPTILDNVNAHWQRYGRGNDHTRPGSRLPLPMEIRTDDIAEDIAAGPYTMAEIMRCVRALDKRRSRAGVSLRTQG